MWSWRGCVRAECAAPVLKRHRKLQRKRPRNKRLPWYSRALVRVSPHSSLLLPFIWSRQSPVLCAATEPAMSPTASSLDNTLAYRSFEDTAPIQPLKERAYPGLHAEILEQVLKHVRTRGPLLDLACGTGAWLSRLQQHGFSNVLGADRDVASFGLDPAQHVPSNLDEAYAATIDRTFDVITAIEIIE